MGRLRDGSLRPRRYPSSPVLKPATTIEDVIRASEMARGGRTGGRGHCPVASRQREERSVFAEGDGVRTAVDMPDEARTNTEQPRRVGEPHRRPIN